MDIIKFKHLSKPLKTLVTFGWIVVIIDITSICFFMGIIGISIIRVLMKSMHLNTLKTVLYIQ